MCIGETYSERVADYFVARYASRIQHGWSGLSGRIELLIERERPAVASLEDGELRLYRGIERQLANAILKKLGAEYVIRTVPAFYLVRGATNYAEDDWWNVTPMGGGLHWELTLRSDQVQRVPGDEALVFHKVGMYWLWAGRQRPADESAGQPA